MVVPNYFPRYYGGYYYNPWYYGGYWPGNAYYVPVPYPYYVPVPETYAPSTQPRAALKNPAQAEQPAEPSAPVEPKQQREQDAARQLKLANNLANAAAEEEQMGQTEDAQRLLGLAKKHYQEIAQKYPTTKAGREAKRLMKEQQVSPPIP
jgi:hypothetical protein